MKHHDPDRTRTVPRAGDARVVAIAGSGRRRAACAAACFAALATALAFPPSARAGWPLATAAPCALGFGATYSAPDGTASTHRGVDLSAPAGAAVRAPLSGRVSFAGRVPGTGGGTILAVTIATSSGSLTLMPLSSAGVKAGMQLAEGESVGELAGTGDGSSASPHLHVGARKGDLYVDPMSLLVAPAAAPAEGSPELQPDSATQSQPTRTAAAMHPAPQTAAAARVDLSGSGSAVAQGAATGAQGAATAGQVAPLTVAVPGASVAPGVSVAGGAEEAAAGASTMQSVSRALSAAVGGTAPGRSGDGAPGGALLEWALGAAARGLQAGARVLAAVLLALGALWPIWRRERRKGPSQLSVRPSSDDVAAVTGR